MGVFRYSERGAAITAKWQTGHRNALPWLWGCTALAALVLLARLVYFGGLTAAAWSTNIAAIVFSAVVCTVLMTRERKTAKNLSRCSFLLMIEEERVEVIDPVTKETRFRCAFGDILRADCGSEIVRLQTAFDGVCLPKECVPKHLTDYLQSNDGCAVYTRSWM